MVWKKSYLICIFLFWLQLFIYYLKFTETEWNQIYQKCPYMIGNSKQTKSELMVRPAFPFFLCESEEPLEAPSNVLVAVHEMWKVGHLVDYLCDDCYWSATIVELLGENNFLVSFSLLLYFTFLFCVLVFFGKNYFSHWIMKDNTFKYKLEEK